MFLFLANVAALAACFSHPAFASTAAPAESAQGRCPSDLRQQLGHPDLLSTEFGAGAFFLQTKSSAQGPLRSSGGATQRPAQHDLALPVQVSPLRSSESVAERSLSDSRRDEDYFEQVRRDQLETIGGVEEVRPFPKDSSRGLYLWDYFVPERVCPDVVRIGRIGDGGKWLCGITELEERGPLALEALAAGQRPSCVVFSYGVNDETSFEAALLKRAPACVIHAFDPTIGRVPTDLEPFSVRPLSGSGRPGQQPRVIWHKIGIAANTGGVAASGSRDFPWVESLTDATHRLGVEFIDILKVDVEGAEFPSLIPVLEQLRPEDPLLFGQLLIEFHAEANDEVARNGTTANDIFRLMDNLHRLGYRPFSKEENLGPSVNGQMPWAFEYSFIHPQVYARKHPLRKHDQVSLASLPLAPPPYTAATTPPGMPKQRKSVIYYLTRVETLPSFHRSLELLHRNFNWYHHYPIVVFHERIPEVEQQKLANITEGLYELRFIEISDYWERSLPVPQHLLTQGIPEVCRCSPQSSTVGYRRMIHFQAYLAFEILHERLGYEWLWRLDDDSEIGSPIGYDPFQLMASNGWKYGTVSMVSDPHFCVEGLWQLAADFVANHTDQLPHGTGFFDMLPPGLVFYNNFEISHASLWSSPLYRDWSQAVLDNGGIFSRRWGDAPLRTLAVSMLLHPDEVHFFDDIGYKHSVVNQQAQGLGARTYGMCVANASNSSNASSSGASLHNRTNGTRCRQTAAYGFLRTVPRMARSRGELMTAPHDELSNGALFSIVRQGDSVASMLASFEEHFLRRRPYTFILVYDVEDSAMKDKLIAAASSLVPQHSKLDANQTYPVRSVAYGNASASSLGEVLAPVALSFPLVLWPAPGVAPTFDAASVGAAEQEEAAELRFLHARFAQLLASEMGIDWLWHVGERGKLEEPVRSDPFAEVESKGFLLGHKTLEDSQSKGDWTEAEQLASDVWRTLSEQLSSPLAHVRGANQTMGAATQWALPERPASLQLWTPKGTSTASISILGLLSHVSVWEHPATLLLLHRMERAGRQSALRQPALSPALHTLALLASASQSEIATLPRLPYSDVGIPWTQLRVQPVLEAPGSHGPRHFKVLPPRTILRTMEEAEAEGLPKLHRGHQGVDLQAIGWLGGDVGASVPLPPANAGSTADESTWLWLFGDSLLGTSEFNVRKKLSKMVHSSVGRSASNALPTEFEWGLAIDGAGGIDEADVFPCDAATRGNSTGKCYLWLEAGIAIVKDGVTSAVLLAQRVQEVEQDLEVAGTVAIVVHNPHEHASSWRWSMAEIPGHIPSWSNGIACASGAPWATADGAGDDIYIMGNVGTVGFLRAGPAVLARVAAADLLALRLDRLELLSGDVPGAWAKVSAAQASPFRIFEAPSQESSFLKVEALDIWLTPTIQSSTILRASPASLALRAALSPEGPWGDITQVFILPDELTSAGWCYAPRLHSAIPERGFPQRLGSAVSIAVSVICAPLMEEPAHFMELPSSIYTPQFFNIRLSL